MDEEDASNNAERGYPLSTAEEIDDMNATEVRGLVKDYGTLPLPFRVVISAIPFSHQMMAIRELMFGNCTPVIGGVINVSASAIAMIAVTIWIFNTERLPRGGAKKGLSNAILRILTGGSRLLG